MMNMTDQDSQMPEDPSTLDTEDMYESHAQESAEESFRAIIESTNLVDKFDKDDLETLAEQCSSGFEYDLESRREWDDAAEEWTKLALQFREEKTYPWRGAANVKYPLLSTAAMQFNARAYPSLVPSSGDIVKAITIGKDSTGEKKVKAERISKYMSYQVLHQMTGWEEDMDKLLMILPIVGLAFKKTYFNSTTKKNVSELIMPANLVVDYWTKSLDDAERISEIIMMSKRVLKSRQMSGIFAEVDLPDPVISENNSGQGVRQDETLPYELIEQHCYFDRDGDGYPEPYIVTFERHSKTVLRVVARFDEEGISLDDDGELQEIRATQYYTKYGFIPNPDGSFYDIGFGVLLGPLNESVNTLINQLLDSGHLSTLQAGFLGKGLKLKMGEQQFKPGEWKTINSTADDLKKQILPLPTREPSNVLFQLMGTLITSGKELASVAEIFVGKMPGQNTPATTTMATIEQGMKVFTAVYKRIYRSLSGEFQKLFDLNKTYLNPQEYQTVLDAEIGSNDFDKSTYDVCPGADPNAMSQTEKLMKAQGLLELLPLGVLDPIKVISRVLEAQDQPNWQDLFTAEIQQSGQMPPPPPDPKLQEMQMKGQIEQQKVAMQAEAQQHKMELEGRSKQVQLAMKAQEHQMDMQHKAQMANMDAAEKIHMQRIFSAEGMQKIAMNQAQGEQKLQQMKKEGAVKSQQKANGATGKKTSAPKKSS
jgi:chaperonin GroES